VSYTAAHSPLQPDPESIIVVSSDNGGSVWFGGLNQPLRAGKHTPFEGGVRVPAFVVDFSGNYIGNGGRELDSLIHVSDWLPTIMSWANAEHLLQGIPLDGIDQSETFKTEVGARNEVLLELYTRNDTHDKREMAAFRRGRYKVITGDMKEWFWYYESPFDGINSSDELTYPKVIIERLMKLLDDYFGVGKPEMLKKILLHFGVFLVNGKRIGHQTMLFDLEADPEERDNIAEKNADIVTLLLGRVEEIKKERPQQQLYWMKHKRWDDSFVPGDCSADSTIPPSQCRFVTFFLADDEVINSEDLVDSISELKMFALKFLVIFLAILVFVVILLVSMWKCLRRCFQAGSNQKVKKQ